MSMCYALYIDLTETFWFSIEAEALEGFGPKSEVSQETLGLGQYQL